MPSLRHGKGAGKAMCDGNFSPGITTDTSTAIFAGTYHVTFVIINAKAFAENNRSYIHIDKKNIRKRQTFAGHMKTN